MDLLRVMFFYLADFENLSYFLREHVDELLTDNSEQRCAKMIETCGAEFKEGLQRELELIRAARVDGVDPALDAYNKKYFLTP